MLKQYWNSSFGMKHESIDHLMEYCAVPLRESHHSIFISQGNTVGKLQYP